MANGSILGQGGLDGRPPFLDLALRATVTRVRMESDANYGLGAVRLTNWGSVTDSIIRVGDGTGISVGAWCRIAGNFVNIDGSNSGTAILAGSDSILKNNTTFALDGGIKAGARSIFIGNTAETGGAVAITAGSDSMLINNVASKSAAGISCGDGCTIRGNTVNKNVAWGIKCGSGCSILYNTANDNGETVAVHGIECGGACTVTGNTANNNLGFGLFDSVGGTAYEGNQFDNNNGGNANPQVSGGIEMGTNVCGGDTTCP